MPSSHCNFQHRELLQLFFFFLVVGNLAIYVYLLEVKRNEKKLETKRLFFFFPIINIV